jgi:hypothetical protein
LAVTCKQGLRRLASGHTHLYAPFTSSTANVEHSLWPLEGRKPIALVEESLENGMLHIEPLILLLWNG